MSQLLSGRKETEKVQRLLVSLKSVMLFPNMFVQVAAVLLPCLPAGRLEEAQGLLQEGDGEEAGTQELAGSRLEMGDKLATI